MSLSPEQRAKYSQMQELMPLDAVSGYSVEPTEDPRTSDSYAKYLNQFSKDTRLNAFAYFNYNTKQGGPQPPHKRRVVKVISAEGFPPDIAVSYAYPPPFAYRTQNGPRNVKHFVLHSFGHGWHATPNGDRWLNSTRPGRGVIPVEYKGKTIYIAGSSDLNTYTNRTRFAAGLRACLNSDAKATAHFFIDRAGNLVIIGDCNDIMYTSNALNPTSVGVELEEAFYVQEDTKKTKAVFRFGGNPPGTAGNIVYFTYSDKQLLTLSILCKKLEMAYPDLQQRNILIGAKDVTPDSPPGYTMHDFIKGSKHFDVSPHFLNKDLWQAFFELVDTHTHINGNNIFKPMVRWEKLQEGVIQDPDANAITQRATAFVTTKSLANDRAYSILNQNRQELNALAASRSVEQSNTVNKQQAVIQQAIIQTKRVKVGLPASSQAIDAYSRQVNSDGWW